MSQKRTPGATSLRAASFARRTVSCTSRSFSLGSPNTKVRVMSEQYSPLRQPTSNRTTSPLASGVSSGSWCGSAAFAPKLTMGVNEWPCAPSSR